MALGAIYTMRKAFFAAILGFLALLFGSAGASYGYPFGGAYGALEYPNSYYNLSFSYWSYDGPYVYVDYYNYSPYHYYSYSFSGCGNYWCYYPAPYYYGAYYSYYPYGSYVYSPGYYFRYNW
jgi:hypothetical protein